MKNANQNKLIYRFYEPLLKKKGFSAEEIEEIQSKPHPVEKNIATYYDELKQHFSYEQILAIASSREINGIETLLNMAKNDLLKSTLNTQQICTIFCNSGTKSLAIACNNTKELQLFGLNPEQIVKIAANRNGYLKIQTLCNNLEIVEMLKITPDKIMEMLAHSDGYRQLQEHVNFLSEQIDLEIENEKSVLAELESEREKEKEKELLCYEFLSSNSDEDDSETTQRLLDSFFDPVYFTSKPPSLDEREPKRLRIENDHAHIIAEDDTFNFPAPEFQPQLDEVILYKEYMTGDWTAGFFPGPAREISVKEDKVVLSKKLISISM